MKFLLFYSISSLSLSNPNLESVRSPLTTMWRSSTRSFSSKLLFASNPPPRFNGGILFQSQIHSSGAGVFSSVDSFKLGFKKPDGGAALRFASSDAILNSSTAVSLSQHVSEAIRHYGRCYWELSKARLSMLVVATSGAGFVLGSGGLIDFAGLCWTCGGTMMVAASANSLNQVFEVKNDAKMKRTRLRPLPSGRISVPHAAIWASTVGIAGTTILADKANFLTAGLAASTLALYAFVYTPLKQIHPANTWVGAVVGAIPPLLGWAAASGEVSLNGMILPAALYFWQLPHFMALAYLCRNDYVDGGFRMFSLADASGQRTSLVALRNCIYLLPLGFFAYDWGLTSEWFFAESTLLTLAMGAGALSFCLDRTSKNTRRMFHASLLYLPVFMAGMLIHRLPNGNPQELPATNSNKLLKLPFSDSQIDGFEDDNLHIEPRKSIRTRARPPVSYASVAPFPFLPVPVYASDT